MGYKSQDNHQQSSNNCLLVAHGDYNILIITLNPHLNLLESNIKTRSQGLPIDSMEQEAQYLHSQYLVHKNFSSIIGYQQLINQWDSQRFHWDTFKYAKSQKKWINYFLKMQNQVHTR